MSALEVIAFVSIGLFVYSYAVYPLVLLVVAGIHQTLSDVSHVFRKGDRRERAPQDWPVIAVVISAYNEEMHIEARVNNLLSIDYPADKLNIYIGSDGSTDRTAEILKTFKDPRVHAFPFERNRGKATVLNDLVHRIKEPILVFSDANTFFAPQALKALVTPFSDKKTGGVSGELRLLEASGDNQDSLYWRVEQLLKFLEARIGGLLGANGAIYAIRRKLWIPLKPDTICDDFCIAMNVSARGQRLVYEPSAWAEEDTPGSIGDEYKRRVRIGIGNYQALCRQPDYLLSTSWGTKLAYLSHKVLRWIGPHLLIIGFVASVLLASDPAWQTFAWAQAIVYGGSALLYAAVARGKKLPGLLRIPAFLFALNWAFLVASFRYATGRYSGSWRRTMR